jgi:hypothetical protein
MDMKNAIGIALLLTTSYVYGQKNITDQNLFWYGLFTTIEINEKWYIQGEVQERHYVNPTAQHQFLIRSHIHRVLGESGWETSAGMCLFLQNPNDPNALVKLTVPELRPHVEFVFKQKLKNITFDHRYRAEARFFHNINASMMELEDGFEFGNFRLRYRLQATIPLYKLDDKGTLKLKVGDEIHLNAGNGIVINVFDQNRIYAALNYEVSKNVSAEVGYLNWFQQRPNGAFFNRNILNCSVSYKIKRNKT